MRVPSKILVAVLVAAALGACGGASDSPPGPLGKGNLPDPMAVKGATSSSQ